jgi:hypothetical protein
MRYAALSLGLVLAASIASADPVDEAQGRPAGSERGSERAPGRADDQLVLLNASARIGSLGQIDRIRRVLDQRGLLARLPERLEATLDGRNVLIGDLDAIKAAYGRQDYAAARALIDADEQRILSSLSGGDPMPALAQLSELHGLIAVAEDHGDEAVAWFRAAYRFNPAQVPEKQLTSPRVRALVKLARTETQSTGRLRIDADPETAIFQVDGGKPQSVTERIELPVGYHLVQITAEGRKSYAELVDVRDGKLEKIAIALDRESSQDKAARLVDATVAAPTGKARLNSAKGLSRLTGVQRMLVIEEGGDDHVTVRIYDVGSRKVSRPLDLEGSATSAMIARKILAALDPENMTEASTVMVIERARPAAWYQHWYVWAGAALLLGGGIATYELVGRAEPPGMIRGF